MQHTSPLVTERMDLPEGFEDWTREKAMKLAQKEGIELTDAHWEVIHFLRHHCKARGASCSARHVLKALTRRFAE